MVIIEQLSISNRRPMVNFRNGGIASAGPSDTGEPKSHQLTRSLIDRARRQLSEGDDGRARDRAIHPPDDPGRGQSMSTSYSARQRDG